MNAKSNELVNELVSAGIAFGRQVEPDWQTRINKAQRELREYIDELEAEYEKIDYFFRKLRMFCIFAHWDNPNTEADFYKVDAEIREYLSEYKVCDQLTAHGDIERQDDKWIPEVQE